MKAVEYRNRGFSITKTCTVKRFLAIMRFFKLFGRDRLVRIAAIVSLCGMLIFTTSSIQRRRISDALDKAAFEAALVNNCLDRASKLGGRTFEFKASRVNVSYAGWTDDESFDKEDLK